MQVMRTNRRITIKRPSATLTGLSAATTLDVIHSDVRAWVKFSNSLILTTDGSEVSSDGEMRVTSAYGVQQGDVMYVVDDAKRYRMEGVDELLSPRGRVVGHRAFLIRDTTLEA